MPLHASLQLAGLQRDLPATSAAPMQDFDNDVAACASRLPRPTARGDTSALQQAPAHRQACSQKTQPDSASSIPEIPASAQHAYAAYDQRSSGSGRDARHPEEHRLSDDDLLAFWRLPPAPAEAASAPMATLRASASRHRFRSQQTLEMHFAELERDIRTLLRTSQSARAVVPADNQADGDKRLAHPWFRRLLVVTALPRGSR